MQLIDLKQAYRISDAWRDLGLPNEPGKICRSPFPGEHRNGDANPSFSVFDEGRRWRDFATGESGTVIDLVAKARGCSVPDAIRFVEARLGVTRRARQPEQTNDHRTKIPSLRTGTDDEIRALADHRGFSTDGLLLAQQRGFLHFTNLWGNSAWCITDSRRELFEFRRLDCGWWPAFGRLPERKCHCFGSGKKWPIGILESEQFEKIVVVEGAPDMLAAFHFLQLEAKQDSVAPVGILGAANHMLASEALKHLRGKRICLYPHADDAGRNAARKWARQFKDAGAERVTAFDFSGLIRTDGTPGKDLADVAHVDAICFERERKFWEVMP